MVEQRGIEPKRTIIGLIGRAGAGKSSLAAALASSLEVSQVVAVSDVVRNHLGRQGRSITRESMADAGQALVDRAVADLAGEVVAEAGPSTSVLIVDGVRHEEFARALRDHVDPALLILVWVHTTDEERTQRLLGSGMERNDIDALAKHPTERTIEDWAPRLATVVVSGEGPLGDAVAQVVELV